MELWCAWHRGLGVESLLGTKLSMTATETQREIWSNLPLLVQATNMLWGQIQTKHPCQKHPVEYVSGLKIRRWWKVRCFAAKYSWSWRVIYKPWFGFKSSTEAAKTECSHWTYFYRMRWHFLLHTCSHGTTIQITTRTCYTMTRC